MNLQAYLIIMQTAVLAMALFIWHDNKTNRYNYSWTSFCVTLCTIQIIGFFFSITVELINLCVIDILNQIQGN